MKDKLRSIVQSPGSIFNSIKTQLFTIYRTKYLPLLQYITEVTSVSQTIANLLLCARAFFTGYNTL
jgi:hypothetical protein